MRPACALRPYPPVAHYGLSRCRLACLHGRPQVVADNAQGGDILDDPFFLRIWAGPAANHLGVLDEPLAVPDEAPDVELVVQYSCAAPPVAVDRRRPPGIAAGPWYAPVTWVLRDRSWALAGREGGEDAVNAVRLLWIEFA